MCPPTQPNPLISVLVPTYDRPDLVAQLLGALDGQTLPASEFELILVDDGSKTPVLVDQGAHAYPIRPLRQENAGPGAARNRGLQQCSAPLTLILNDDAVPAPDLLEKHLQIHRERPGRHAVLGTFHFSARALLSPFTQVLAESDLLFAFPTLEHDQLHPWTYFWTCNISIQTEALRAVGGFDAETFDRAIVEDVELGYRLEKKGYRVLYREDARCEHDHALSPKGYFDRMVHLGVYLARMFKKHRDATVLWCPPGEEIEASTLLAAQATVETLSGKTQQAVGMLTQKERELWGQELSSAEKEPLKKLVRRLGFPPFYRGVLRELEGADPLVVMDEGPTQDVLTSLVVVSHNALDQTRRCLESLREHAEPGFPMQFVFVDNGSDDGTVEFLSEQSDVQLLPNDRNLGAPRARNQGLALAKGDFIVFMDNDVMVTPQWLSRLHYHAQVDSRSGCVGCLSDRAAHKQQIELPVAPEPDAIAKFARKRSREFHRTYRASGLQTSFLMMVRKELIDTIGGFDEAFSPWGFEDDDFSLRSHLAGFRNRVALDVFVRHEPYQGTAKSKKHGELLERNWQRFAAKWGLGTGGRDSQNKRLEGLDPGDFELESLRVPIESIEREKKDSGSSNPSTRASKNLEPTLSSQEIYLCMIVRDEAENIEACLRSAADWVDHMVVVDTGSQDNTVELAAAMGAKIVHHAWKDDFAAARNAALPFVPEGFILLLDADERLVPGAGRALREAVNRGGFDCARLPLTHADRTDASPGEVLAGSNLGPPVYLERLFRKTSNFAWEGVVHEHVTSWAGQGCRIIQIPAHIVHYGSVPEVREAKDKNGRNRRLLELACANEPDNATYRVYLAEDHYNAGELEPARKEAERAWGRIVKLHGAGKPIPNPIPAATLHCFLAMGVGDFHVSGEVLARAHEWAEPHPNLHVLDAMLEKRKIDHRATGGTIGQEQYDGGLERIIEHCDRSKRFAGQVLSAPAIPGATGWLVNSLRGQALLQLGRLEQALDAFDSALQDRPQHLESVLGQAETRILMGEADQALASLEPLLHPKIADGWILAAWAGLHFGGIEGVVDLIGQARKVHELRPPLAEHRTRILEELEAEVVAARQG